MASRFRKIYMSMYGDAKFNALSAPPPNAQTLWVYLLTGPHTSAIPGLSCVGEAALAEALGWPIEALPKGFPKGFREAFAELSAKGMVKADWKARVIWIPNAVKFNDPESPNVIRGWRKAWDEIPECNLKFEALSALSTALGNNSGRREAFKEAFKEALPKGLPEAFGKPCLNQEQEQEHEQEQEQEHEQEHRNSCSEPSQAKTSEPTSAAISPTVMTFGVVGKDAGEWQLTEANVAEFQVSYPGIDVIAECRKARQWCIANPSKRKTRKGMPRFLNNWLSHAQDDCAKPRNQTLERSNRNGSSRPQRIAEGLTLPTDSLSQS